MPIEELKRPDRIDEDRIAKLKELFPEAFGDGKLNIEILKDEIEGLNVNLIEDNTEEYYGLQWVGKKEARKLALLPPQGTLKYKKGDGINESDTKNLFFEGDNLEILRILQKSYANRIKVIYIDPPYNRGEDLIYKDDYKDPVEKYLQKTGQMDEEGLLTSNPKDSGRFHANWLNMIYPRLKVAKNLLKEDGVIFVSIDHNEMANLRRIMDEIFGEENLLSELIWDLGTGTQAGHFVRAHEYILVYAKNKDKLPNFSGGEGTIEHSALKKISKKNPSSHFTFPKGTRFEAVDGTELKGEWGGSEKTFLISGRMIAENGVLKESVTLEAGWAMKGQMEQWFSGKETFDSKGQKVLEFYFNSSGVLKYKKERSVVNPPSIIKDVGSTKSGSQTLMDLFGENDVFDFPKPIALMKFLLRLILKDNEYVLDFFAGSGTTAQAVLELNREDLGKRRFMLVQLPVKTNLEKYNTIADITKERIKKSIEHLSREDDQKVILDEGFVVYELDKTNIRKWEGYEGENLNVLNQNLDLFTSTSIIEEANDIDVVTELMLSQGFPLDSSVKVIEKSSNSLWIAQHEDVPFPLVVCLDGKLQVETGRFLNDEYGKGTFICLDNALSNEQKILLSESMNVKTI
ncbi:adenine-specific DNA-methyltransferase [Ureibacillus xyleni]|uniref:Adenine-specific DNA-methyltransferase n=1 Tax=Ureibacillus xyleni TaxID=614648 RepID=A0A285TNW6_9BACL|nr:site-specific DNA-methyltransferase [Ureibacillus xyleni]SOC24542.1 adenine-specific DNA-methyltransferase [Ureibacillus xyleni]